MSSHKRGRITVQRQPTGGEKLESLKTAGLIDDREYREKRQEILKEL